MGRHNLAGFWEFIVSEKTWIHLEQEASSQMEIAFRLWEDIQSLRKAGVFISCAWEVPFMSTHLLEPGVFRPGEV